MIRFFYGCLLLLLISGCTSQDDNMLNQLELCSPEWFMEVDKLVTSGDGYGHGPDVGSDEWKWVITHRLKLDKLPTLPEVGSQKWCEFINLELTK